MRKYQVSEIIGRGGMAEVFLARQEGIGGFEKLVALKRIYPHLVHDQSFIEMFLGEARVAASLQHSKIVQILDIETDDDGFFIVMEYLAGESILQIFEELVQRGVRMPPEIVCRIGADVATGLHVAHMASDAEGHSRPVVHRDVTPSNILVGFSGAVKVLDFGVAKAAKRHITTEKGVIKGKAPYLTPEQIEGLAVDPRADVFQLGIVLHEMLTGERLFDGDSFPVISRAITQSEIAAPSSVNSDVPAALDPIILKALKRDPAERFQTAEDLAQELDSVARSFGEPVTERTLGRWMSATFPEREQQKARLKKAALERTQAAAAESTLPPPGSQQGSALLETVIGRPRPANTRKIARSTLWIAGLLGFAGLLGLAGLGAMFMIGGGESRERSELPPRSATRAALPAPESAIRPDAGAQAQRISLSTVPVEATIEIDGKRVASGKYTAHVKVPFDLKVSADGYESQQFEVSLAHPAPDLVRLLPAVPPAASGANQKRPRKPPAQPDPTPIKRTKPFGSDNLNPWE